MRIRDFLKEKNGAYILQKILNTEKSALFLREDEKVPQKALEIMQKVNSGYPVEYLFEEVWFYGERFYIKEGVLIPRDDTEAVLEKAVELINSFEGGVKVVDCCTGSGVIAVELAKLTDADITATDISDTALEVAQKNINLHGVKVDVKKCDLLKCGDIKIKADILVANPPYVQNGWKKPNDYEPDIAFYGGEDGLDVVKRLITEAKLLNYSAAVIEIGYNQKELLEPFLNKTVNKHSFFKDLAGNTRGVEIIF